mgnify:FL=1
MQSELQTGQADTPGQKPIRPVGHQNTNIASPKQAQCAAASCDDDILFDVKTAAQFLHETVSGLESQARTNVGPMLLPATNLSPNGSELLAALNTSDVKNVLLSARCRWTSKSGKVRDRCRPLTSDHRQAFNRKLRGMAGRKANLKTLTKRDLCGRLSLSWCQQSSDFILEEVERGRLPAPISLNPVLWSSAEVDSALKVRRIQHAALIAGVNSDDPDAWKGNVTASHAVDHNALKKASINWITPAIRNLNRPIAYEMTLSFPITGPDADKSDAALFNQRHDYELRRLNNQLLTEVYRAVGLRRTVSEGYFHIIVPETKSASGSPRRWHWHSILFLNEEEFSTFLRIRPLIIRRILSHCKKKVARAQIEFQPVDCRYVPYALKHAADNLTDIRTNIPGLAVNT